MTWWILRIVASSTTWSESRAMERSWRFVDRVNRLEISERRYPRDVAVRQILSSTGKLRYDRSENTMLKEKGEVNDVLRGYAKLLVQ